MQIRIILHIQIYLIWCWFHDIDIWLMYLWDNSYTRNNIGSLKRLNYFNLAYMDSRNNLLNLISKWKSNKTDRICVHETTVAILEISLLTMEDTLQRPVLAYPGNCVEQKHFNCFVYVCFFFVFEYLGNEFVGWI